MATSRQKILIYLKKNVSATTQEIARALRLSAPNVRHHLSALMAEGQVEILKVRFGEGKGRPRKIYSLAQSAWGDNLSALASALLDESASMGRVEAIAKRLLNPSQFVGLSMNERLTLLIKKLNEMNYYARWEAGAAGPRILFGRCPYARIVDEHPELCAMDEALLNLALGSRISVLRRVEHKQGGCPFLFEIKQPERQRSVL
ncbi:MAG: winged helix-turn-helix transcriptional regulator [Anaerolineales bacterium]|nr:winged helix-turn-helix transcriptional regulator [Anaerolineales bacterium]